MKTMKTTLAFVAGALALSACNNEDAILNENQNENGAKLVTLTAYQEGEDATRAAINNGSDKTKINWTASDAIKVFGTSTSAQYTTTTGGSTSANFTGTEVAGAAYALHPYQENATNNAGVITAEVPMTQYAVDGSFDPKAALMVGTVNSNTGSVEFKNVMSYVKVCIPDFGDGKKCKQVTIKAKDEWVTLAGKVNITVADEPTWAETYAKEGQAFVRLVPASGDQIAAGTYYIAVLPQTMSTGFEVIYNVDDVIYYKQTTKSDDATKKFIRNNVKNIGTLRVNLSTYYNYTFKVEATVDLTKPDGASYTTLKMADRNIGATWTDSSEPSDATAYGDYFAWGALRPAYTKKPASGTTLTDLYWSNGFTDVHVPSTFTDIAAMLWGGNWRMATKDEWSKNTTNTSVRGLPLGNCYTGTSFAIWNLGCYWSSSPSEASNAYYFSNGGNIVPNTNRYYGFSVRPVLVQ